MVPAGSRSGTGRARGAVVHWSKSTVAECGSVVVTVGEGGTSDLSRVTCAACLEMATFSEAERKQLRSDPPKSRAERRRIATELAAICKQHGITFIGDAVMIDERNPVAKKKAVSGAEMVKVERFTRNLRVALKEGEIVERAKRSAFLLGEMQQKESERDAAKKQANAQIEELSSEMHRLSLEVRDGAAYRDVQCTRHYVYRLGTVEERRADTNELIHERPMTERERQLELEGLAGPKDAGAEANALGDALVKDEAPPLPTEKKRKPRKPKAQQEASA